MIRPRVHSLKNQPCKYTYIMDSVNARVRQIRREFCNGSNRDFAKRMKKTPNTVNNWIREGYSVGRGVLADIANEFPEIDEHWLRTGEGDMLKSDLISAEATNQDEPSSLIEAYNKIVDTLHGISRSHEILAQSNKTMADNNSKLLDTNAKLVDNMTIIMKEIKDLKAERERMPSKKAGASQIASDTEGEYGYTK